MPLVRGPTATRRPRRSENDRIAIRPHDEEQRTGIHRRDHGEIDRPANGVSPFRARPIQFEAMKPNSISSAGEAIGVFGAGGLQFQGLDRSERGLRSRTVLSAWPWP